MLGQELVNLLEVNLVCVGVVPVPVSSLLGMTFPLPPWLIVEQILDIKVIQLSYFNS